MPTTPLALSEVRIPGRSLGSNPGALRLSPHVDCLSPAGMRQWPPLLLGCASGRWAQCVYNPAAPSFPLGPRTLTSVSSPHPCPLHIPVP